LAPQRQWSPFILHSQATPQYQASRDDGATWRLWPANVSIEWDLSKPVTPILYVFAFQEVQLSLLPLLAVRSSSMTLVVFRKSSMARLTKIIDVHSHPVLAFGERAPLGEGHNIPIGLSRVRSLIGRSMTSPLVLSAPAFGQRRHWTGSRELARPQRGLAEIVSGIPGRFGAVATLPGLDADGALTEIDYSLVR